MLPANLLITRRKGGRIEPVWLLPTSETISLVNEIEQIFQESVGRKRSYLDDLLRDFEESADFDYRVVRGIATLLDRRCTFQQSSKTEPKILRQMLFREAAKGPIPITDEERKAVLARVANNLKIPVSELEANLYADLKSENIVKSFTHIEPELLVNQYNLSIAQTLLFNSTSLSFHGNLDWKAIFGLVKWLGLMYEIQEKGSGYLVTVTGPFVLLRASKRYGTRLAMLLPHIVRAKSWSLSAKIAGWRDGKNAPEYVFEINSKKHAYLFRQAVMPFPESFDSSVEEQFARDFKNAKTGWSITREPRPLKAGKYVLIPDFEFEKDGMHVYLEIVGYWTPEYLAKKISKLRDISDTALVVAADENNACQEFENLPETIHVIYYREKVPVGPIVHYLRIQEKVLKTAQVQELEYSDIPIQLDKPVVPLSELAKDLGVIDEAMRTYLKRKPITGYTLLGDLLISDEVLQEVNEVLEQKLTQGELSLAEANTIIGSWGVPDALPVLEFLGYAVDWETLDPNELIIYKRNS